MSLGDYFMVKYVFRPLLETERFECLKYLVYKLHDSAVFCALYNCLANLQLTRSFSMIDGLLVYALNKHSIKILKYLRLLIALSPMHIYGTIFTKMFICKFNCSHICRLFTHGFIVTNPTFVLNSKLIYKK